MNTQALTLRLLTDLGVPHTEHYTADALRNMSFRSLYGLCKLLESYGIATEAYRMDPSDRDDLIRITPPFIAQCSDGLTLITDIDPNSVTVASNSDDQKMSIDKFLSKWSGTVLLAFPSPTSKEPEYSKHARLSALMKAKKWVTAICYLFILAYLVVTDRFAHSTWDIFLLCIDGVGLWMSYMLVQKSLKIHSATADHVCGVLQAGGCDHIIESKASTFMGLFRWSDVGLAYFSVSLLALILFPESIAGLALCNICCLPFTVWSIWYQHWRAHHWCTLCVCVQASLWLLFAGYLFAGAITFTVAALMQASVIAAAYIAVMLTVNAIVNLILRHTNEAPHET